MEGYSKFPSFSSRTNGNPSQYQIHNHPQASEGSNQSRQSAYQLDHPQDSIGFNHKRKRVEEEILEENALLKENNNKLIAENEYLKRIIYSSDFPQAMRELLQRNALLEEFNNKLLACIQGRVNGNGNGPEFTPIRNPANAAEAGPSSSSKMVKPNHVVQGVDTSKSSRVKWDGQLTRAFCKIWINNPRLSAAHDDTIERWGKIVIDFKATTGVALTQEKLKNKVDELRRKYKKGGQVDPELQELLQCMFGNPVSTKENTRSPSSIVASDSNGEQQNEISHQLISRAPSRGATLAGGVINISEGGIDQERIPQVNAISTGFQGQEVYAPSLPPMMPTLPYDQYVDEFDVQIARFSGEPAHSFSSIMSTSFSEVTDIPQNEI